MSLGVTLFLCSFCRVIALGFLPDPWPIFFQVRWHISNVGHGFLDMVAIVNQTNKRKSSASLALVYDISRFLLYVIEFDLSDIGAYFSPLAPWTTVSRVEISSWPKAWYMKLLFNKEDSHQSWNTRESLFYSPFNVAGPWDSWHQALFPI